jgi:hypothetical protein
MKPASEILALVGTCLFIMACGEQSLPGICASIILIAYATVNAIRLEGKQDVKPRM